MILKTHSLSTRRRRPYTFGVTATTVLVLSCIANAQTKLDPPNQWQDNTPVQSRDQAYIGAAIDAALGQNAHVTSTDRSDSAAHEQRRAEDFTVQQPIHDNQKEHQQ